jgi:putative spermidine/putrescine transport system ATP-binding protein
MQSELRRIHREVGTTVIYVTHDQDEAMSLSDRVVVMHNSRVVQVGTPRDIYHSPATSFVAGFVGSASTVAVSCAADRDGHPVFCLLSDGTQLRGVQTRGLATGERGLAVLRPEDARIGKDHAAAANTLKVVVEEKVFLGDRVLCVGALTSGERCEFWVSHEEEPEVLLGRPTPVTWSHERTAIVPLD